MDNSSVRHDPTRPDHDYVLTIEDALAQYALAGLPRTPRSVQRYCAKGHLQSRLIETPFGEKYLITPESVAKHIGYIIEVTPPTDRDMSRPVAAISTHDASGLNGRQAPTEEDDGPNMPRPTAASRDTEIRTPSVGQPTTPHRVTPPVAQPSAGSSQTDTRYIARLESDIEFLRTQIDVKDTQIKDLTERARETNHLIGGLQRMLSPLLGQGDRREPKPDDLGAPPSDL